VLPVAEPPPLAEPPSVALMVATRRAPGWKTMRPSSSEPVCVRPWAAWKRSTAEVVAAVQVPSRGIAWSGSYPSARRLRSSCRTSAPLETPDCRVRYAGRVPLIRITGEVSTRYSEWPGSTTLPCAAIHVTVPDRWLTTLRVSA